MRGGLLVAGLMARAAVRERAAFLAGLLLPIGTLLAVGLVALGASAVDRRQDRDATTVAVPRRAPGATALLGAVEGRRVRLRPVDDPVRALTARSVDLAVELPDGVDATLRAGGAVRVRILYDASKSETLGQDVPAAEEALLRAARRVAGAPGGSLSVQLVDAVEPRSVAPLAARAVPGLVLLVALPVFAGSVRALVGARRDRTTEHLLALPLRRPALLAGMALGSAVTELAHQALFVVPLVMALAALVAVGVVPLVAVPAVLAAAVVTVALAVAAGLAVGARARSERTVGLASGLAFATVLPLLLLAGMRPGTDVTVPMSAVPVAGAVLHARAAAAGGLRPLGLLLGLATTASVAAALLATAVRAVDRHGGLRMG